MSKVYVIVVDDRHCGVEAISVHVREEDAMRAGMDLVAEYEAEILPTPRDWLLHAQAGEEGSEIMIGPPVDLIS